MRVCYYLEPMEAMDYEWITMLKDRESPISFFWLSEDASSECAGSAAKNFGDIIGATVLFEPIKYAQYVANDYQFTEELDGDENSDPPGGLKTE